MSYESGGIGVRALLSAVKERLDHPGANAEHTYWNAHSALELVIELLETAPYNSPRNPVALLDETSFLRAVLTTALDEIAAQARADDAKETGR